MRIRALVLALAVVSALTVGMGVRLGGAEPDTHAPPGPSALSVPGDGPSEAYVAAYDTWRDRDRALRVWRASGARAQALRLFPGLIVSGGSVDEAALSRERGVLDVEEVPSGFPAASDALRSGHTGPAGSQEAVAVYVVDSGVDAAAQDIRGRVEQGWSPYPDPATSDCAGHGTAMARMINSARADSPIRIVPVRIVTCDGRSSPGGGALGARVGSPSAATAESRCQHVTRRAAAATRSTSPSAGSTTKTARPWCRLRRERPAGRMPVFAWFRRASRHCWRRDSPTRGLPPTATAAPASIVWVPMRMVQKFGGLSDPDGQDFSGRCVRRWQNRFPCRLSWQSCPPATSHEESGRRGARGDARWSRAVGRETLPHPLSWRGSSAGRYPQKFMTFRKSSPCTRRAGSLRA